MVQPGAIFEKPVAVDGDVVIRPAMTLSFTWDHRILDGAPIGQFVGVFKEYIENPDLLLL